MFLGSPTPELIQQTAETIAQFIRWIVQLIRRRDWFMLLVLVGVVLAVVGSFFRKWLNLILPDTVEGRFWVSFWVGVAIVFIAALVMAVVTMPRAGSDAPDDAPERQAIKGLRPFNREDAAIFAQLQRRQILRDCAETLTSASYRFGILMGESGCGKTSFLQAGLWPRLTRPESSHLGVYVRFSEQDPLATLYQALAEQLDLPLDWLTASFVEVLTQIQTVDDAKPLVLLLDQFEQVFVHNPRPEQRQPFIQALTAWYQTPTLRTVRVLVSIRADLLHELHELIQALNCNLGPQEQFKLERFAPEAASEILAVIAQTEGMTFDRRFVTELAERELAHPERGTISPVDLQVLAWMIGQQQSEELRAFNQRAFQKFGGVEGLLSRFLEKALAARVLPGQRDAAVKVLLALTDLDRQVRAGVLTLPELQAKMRGTVKPEAISEAVAWLARGDVRLLTPQDKAKQRGYELAHERLIPALLRLENKGLKEADKASRLLERRLNEWLGNGRQGRYLLGLRELWLIRRQWPYLKWGDSLKRRQKAKFVRLSQRRFVWGFGVLASVVAVGLMVWGWLWFTPAGQMQQVQWALERQIAQPNQSQERIADIALAFIKDGQEKKGFEAIEQHISSQREKAKALSRVAEVAVRLADVGLLEKALDMAQGIEQDEPEAKSRALSTIIDAIGKLKDKEVALALLEKSVILANKINYAEFQAYRKVYLLATIANAYRELGDEKSCQAFLEKVLKMGKKNLYEGDILSSVAYISGQLEDEERIRELINKVTIAVHEINDLESKINTFISTAKTYKELGDNEMARVFLEKALDVVSEIDNDGFNTPSILIADAIKELNDSEIAYSLLERFLMVLSEENDYRNHLYILIKVIDVIKGVEEKNRASILLEQALSIANHLIDNHIYTQNKKLSDFEILSSPGSYILDFELEILISIANGYIKMKDERIAYNLLMQALEIINSREKIYQANALIEIANAAANLRKIDSAQEVLGEVLGKIHRIIGKESQSRVLIVIADAYRILRNNELSQFNLEQASFTASKIEDFDNKFEMLIEIANAYQELRDEKIAQRILERVLGIETDINEFDDPSEIIILVAKSVGKLEDKNIARDLLKKTLKKVSEIDDSDDEVEALEVINSVVETFMDKETVQALFREVLAVAAKIDDTTDQASALKIITNSAAEFRHIDIAKDIFQQLTNIAKQSQNSDVLKEIAVFHAFHNDLRKALQILRTCTESDRILAFARIFTHHAEAKRIELINGPVVLNVTPTETKSGAVQLEVTIQSPDEDCEYRADWWEVLSEDGELLGRHLLNEPHGFEQPFTTKDSFTRVMPDQTIRIRSHFSSDVNLDRYEFSIRDTEVKQHYPTQALRGIPNQPQSFQSIRLPARFAIHVEDDDPQPQPCQEKT
ncbi:MAG: NACHT domain-containing protein [Spirulina sp. SIO3F2]|nr:NACHT domain-containing protein [Spirulina sp. SIO3F2]